MFCNITATFPHDRETFGSQFRNCRHSSASLSATLDRFRRLNRNLSYVTPRMHANTWRPSAKHRDCSGRKALQRSTKKRNQLIPRSKANKQNINLGLNEQAKTLRKQFLFSNVYREEVESAREMPNITKYRYFTT